MIADSEHDIVRYRKKKASSRSKASKKSNHLHEYTNVLIRNKYNVNGNGILGYRLGKKCKICGKVATTQCLITSKQPDGTHLALKNNQILELYKDLEIVDGEG